MDTTNPTTSDVTAIETQVAEKQAQISALQAEIHALRAEADKQATMARVAGIAERLGTSPEAVAAFLADVSAQSGYGVSYLIDVVTGEHRVSTPAGRWFE